MENRKTLFLYALTAFLFCLGTQASAETKRFEAADSEGVTAIRDDNAVYLKIAAEVKSPIQIPRLAAPLRSMSWGGIDDPRWGIALSPGLDRWEISWKDRPAGDAALTLQFGDEPLLLQEVKPIEATGDGSFYLPAHLATTRGEKIRYEPQPFKNTIGFWVGKQDSARWKLKLDKPGRFNVAVLQGCGKGQGGSAAVMMFSKKGEKPAEGVIEFDPVLGMLQFDVIETGHFQNFQWVHLGQVELATSGEIDVMVKPQQIKKAALMDIRAIHLIRLPDKK